MQLKGRVLLRFVLAAVLFGLLFWFADALFDYWFFYPDHGSFVDVLIAAPPEHEIYIRLFVFALLLVGALVVASDARHIARTAEQYRGLFRESPNAIFLVDPTDGTFIDFNNRACEILGYDRDTLAALTVADIEAQESKSAVARRLDDIEHKGQTRFETRLLTGDARVIDVEVRTHPLRHQGRPLHLAVVEDISDRKASSQAIEDLHRRMTLALETANVGIWQYDKQTNQLVWDDSMFRLYGLSPDRFEGVYAAWERCVHPEDLEQASKEVSATLLAATPFNTEFRIVRPDGEIRYLQANAHVLTDDNGDARGLIGTNYDVTERRRSELALQQSEIRFRRIYEHTAVGIAQVTLAFRIEHANRAFCQMLGLNQKEIVGKHLREITHPESLPENLEQQSRLGRGEIDHYAMEKRFIHRDGHVVYGMLHANLIRDPAGNPAYFLGCVLDITARIRSELALRETAEKYRQVFEHVGDGIFLSDAEHTVLEANPAAAAILGYDSPQQLAGLNAREIIHPDDLKRESLASAMPELQETGLVHTERRYRHANGRFVPVAVTVSRMQETENFYVVFRDVTIQNRHQQQLEHLAHYDSLTDPPNRVLLADRLKQAMAQAQRRNVALALVYLDLDGFKDINDAYGHEIGDALLGVIADRLREALRKGDTAARLGGDEFVLILIDFPVGDEGQALLQRLLATVAAPIHVAGVTLKVSASLGVTLYPQDGDIDADQLVRQADQAMYQAKLQGKNSAHFFDTSADRNRRVWEADLKRLRQALNDEEFVVFYQPKVNMRTGEVVGAEALVRWQHPGRGLLLPATFLPVIDNQPLGLDLEYWIFNRVLAQMDHWFDYGLTLPISINVSAYHLQQPDFTKHLETMLNMHPNLDPRNLGLEVLESSALKDLPGVSRLIRECAELGVHFALDDFGTGYSSLTYLKHLPTGVLKIDRSFVRDMLDDPEDLAILEGINGMARAFQRQVVAEGVETLAHGEQLLLLGCEVAQGYAIAKPMPANELPLWIDHWSSPRCWTEAPQPVAHADLPALYASVEHRAWIRAIEGYLRGDAEAPPPLALDGCRLGAWLSEEGAQRYDATQAFAEVQAVHERIHRLGTELLDFRDTMTDEQCNALLQALHAERDALLSALKQLIIDSETASLAPPA